MEYFDMKAESATISSIRVPVRPGDRFLINGAVITLGDGEVEVQNHDMIMHSSDIMLPEDANTPSKRIYYWLMLMYLDAQGQDAYRIRLLDDMNDLLNATSLLDVAKSLGLIHQFVQHDDLPRAMTACKALMAFESELLCVEPRAAA
jgi:flagellar biosynthesis repressor protein FlbT